MTSSLVGSEMCIRDSFQCRCCPGQCQCRRQCCQCQCLCGGWLNRTLPVSYTHLTLPTICSV
eukprot:4539416-Prorocentrum_lima.AAC.1